MESGSSGYEGEVRSPGSPLLSSLGIVALASAAGAPACRDDQTESSIDDVADVVDLQDDLVEFYCECYGQLYGYGPMDVQDCLSELGISGETEACLTEVFAANPAELEVLLCQSEAERSLLSCERAEGCPTPFVCASGESVLEEWVCDGEADCQDGSDEQQDCPPPFMCEDGTAVAKYSLCDGFEDCAVGEDEMECPDPFTCGDGTEIPGEWVCDEDSDCEDGSDEQQDCPVTCRSRHATQLAECGEIELSVQHQASLCFPFTCYDDDVQLAVEQRCDGTPDCADGTDEQGCPQDPSGDEGGESTGG